MDAEALQARAELLSVISHELRGPLSVIHLATDALLASAGHDDAARKSQRRVETIKRSADQMARLISDLLDAASLDDGPLVLDLQAQAPATLLSRACNVHRFQANAMAVTLSACVAADVRDVVCDGERVVRLLSGLIENALNSTPERGEVTLRAELETDAATQAPRMVFSVRGGGSDSAAALQAQLARAIRSPRARLGLPLAKSVIEAHGGSLEVQPAGDSGYCVRFALPA